MKKIALINGANLNRLGVREPEIYGSATLKDLENSVVSLGKELGVEVSCFQSNIEGEILNKIAEQQESFNAYFKRHMDPPVCLLK